jgi:hypothetical protein
MDAVSAARGWLDDVFTLLVRHGGYAQAKEDTGRSVMIDVRT